MWDMEEKMEGWRELYQDILKLGYQAKGEKQLEAIKFLENVVYNACRDLARDMDEHQSPKRYDDRGNELVREPSRWEKSKLMMEYVEERVKDMTPQEALKLANLCDRRNKLPKESSTHMIFSFYIGTMVMLQGVLVEKGWGKVKYRAQARLNWFLKQYDHWDIEEKLTEPEKTFQFNENMDSDEEEDPTDKVSANCYSVNLEAMIDLKNYCEREAQARGISRECVLAEIEDKQSNWL
jgi:hypothetical protein